MNLSEDQKKRIEANRARALELKRLRTQNTYQANREAVCSTTLGSTSSLFLQHGSTSSTHGKNLNLSSVRPSVVSDHSSVKVNLTETSSVQDKIEENRKRALALRAAKQKACTESVSTCSMNSQPKSSLEDSMKNATKNIPPHNYPRSSNPQYSGPVHVANCCLESQTRFNVCSKFHSQLIAVIKGMPSRQYDQKTCKWSIHINEHDDFIESCKFLKPQVKVEPLPKMIISSLGNTRKLQESISPLNPLFTKLLPFQKEGVEFALSLNGRVLIADDMGLGKTIQVG